MKNSDTNKLLEYLSSQINQYYQNILVTNKDDKEQTKYIEGLIASLMITKAMSKEELQTLIGKTYFGNFGESCVERRFSESIFDRDDLERHRWGPRK